MFKNKDVLKAPNSVAAVISRVLGVVDGGCVFWVVSFLFGCVLVGVVFVGYGGWWGRLGKHFRDGGLHGGPYFLFFEGVCFVLFRWVVFRIGLVLRFWGSRNGISLLCNIALNASFWVIGRSWFWGSWDLGLVCLVWFRVVGSFLPRGLVRGIIVLASARNGLGGNAIF